MRITILNFITTSIGDSLYILPIVQKLKKEYLGVQLCLTCSKLTKDLLGEEPSLEYQVIPELEKLAINKPRILKIRTLTKILWCAYKHLKDVKPDICIVILPNYPLYQLLPFFAGTKKRLGFTYKKSYFDFTLTNKIRFRNPFESGEVRVHMVDSNLDILKLLEIEITPEDRLLKRTVTDEEHEYIKNHYPDIEFPFIAFQPISKLKFKQWDVNNYVGLGKKLDTNIILFGSPDEWQRCEDIKIGIGKRCKNLAGKVPLKYLGAMLEKCDMMIGNDSGLLHYASSVGCKTLMIFGQTSPLHSIPLGVNESLSVLSEHWHHNSIIEPEPDESSGYLYDITPDMVMVKIKGKR